MISQIEQTIGNDDDDKPPGSYYKISNDELNNISDDISSNVSDELKVSYNGTYGRLQKLSTHLKPDWWSNIFNENYLKTDGDVVENNTITKQEINSMISIMESLGINKNSKILDVCCGQGRHLIELYKNGYKNLIGVDYSNYLLNVAKQRNNDIKFIQADARNIPLNETFDFIQMMGNSYGYFTNIHDNVKVLNEIYRLMHNNSIFILDITNGTHMFKNFNKNVWEWIDDFIIVCRERELSDDKTKLISREIIIDLHNFKIIDQFYSEYLFDITSIKKLLSDNLFDVINIIPYNINSSLEDQHDKGMMEQRYFIICKKNKVSI
jgi:D-alanine-D-alanine ligase